MKSKKPKRILLTSALPYANGSIHIGHLVEYIQTDIYSRFLKLIGENVIYICADDAHGTAIQIKAEQEGITPEELINRVNKEHQKDFKLFHIKFDNYYSTHSDENQKISIEIYNRLKAKGLIYTKEVESYYDKKAKRFLPDRYIKGECPKCGAEDQYGDVCESCNSTYKPIDLVNPYSSITKTKPVRKKSKHYFFKLSAMQDKLKEYFKNRDFQPEIIHYLNNWLDEGLQDWDISRDGPYFGFKIPGEEDKYFYVWLDAPIGYLASCKNYCDRNHLNADDYFFNDDTKIIHVIGKDIMYFHFLFWPAMLMASGFNLPDEIVVHGFLTVSKEKMSKSRGTLLTASEFAAMYPPEYLRYYYARVLSKKMADIDLEFDAYVEAVNNELVGNIANLCYRALSFTEKNFESTIGDFSVKEYPIVDKILSKIDSIKQHYLDFNFNRAVAEIMEISSLGNKFFQDNAPWQLNKEDPKKAKEVCAVACNIVKILSILISPVLPEFGRKLQEQLALQRQTWNDISFDLKNQKMNKSEIIISKIEKADLQIKGREVRDIRINIDQKVKDLGLKAIIAQVNGVKVKKKHEGLERLKKEIQPKVINLNQQQKKTLQDYKRIYKEINVDVEGPTEYLHRLIKEKNQLPQINTVVDSYNIVSAKTMLAVGAHDLNKIKGNINLRFGSDKDHYRELGTKNNIKIPENEFVFVDDDHNVMCRMNIKQGEATKIDENSQNIVLIIDGNRETSNEQLKEAAKEICENIVKFCGGSYNIIDSGFPLNLRVAEIKSAENHPESDKLTILQIDIGEPRQLVAGLQKFYKPKELIGKKIIVVSNLKPAKLGGELSQGMLLAAVSNDKSDIKVLEAPKSNVGDAVLCGDLQNNEHEIAHKEFVKLKFKVSQRKVHVLDSILHTEREDITIDVPDGYHVE